MQTLTPKVTPEPVTGGGADEFCHIIPPIGDTEFRRRIREGFVFTARCGARRRYRPDWRRLPLCPICADLSPGWVA